MPPSPNQNAFFAALQQRSRLPDTATTWRWVGRDEAGLAIIRSDNGTIVRARIAGNAAIGDGDVVLYIPPQPGQGLGQVQLATALPVPFIERREDAIEPGFLIKGLFLRFAADDSLEFYIGNDRPIPEKIFTLPPGNFAPLQRQQSIVATGTGLNDWIVSIATFDFDDNLTIYFIRHDGVVSVPVPSGAVECYDGYAAVYRSLGGGTLEATSYQPDGSIGAVVTATTTLSTQRTINWRTPTFAQIYQASITGATPISAFTLPIGSVFNPRDGSSLGQGPITSAASTGGPVIITFDDGSIFNETAVNFDFPRLTLPFGAAGVFGDSVYQFNGLPTTPALDQVDAGEIATISVERTSFANPSSPIVSSQDIEYYGTKGFDGGDDVFILNASYAPL